MKQKSRIELLLAAIKQWQEFPKVSQKVIAVSVVEKINELGFKDTLADMGISFVSSDCPYDDARINAQKLFRWLGEASDGQYYDPGNIWMIEQAIAAAMPEDIRNSYWNAVCSPTGSLVTKACTKAGQDDYHIPSLLQVVIKESAEAQIALTQIEGCSNVDELQGHLKEVTESIAAFQNAYDIIKGMIESNEQGSNGTNLKAV